MITLKAGRITNTNFKAKHIQAVEEALMDILTIGHAAATTGLKDASCSYTENILTEKVHKATLHDLFTRNLERWGQISEFMDIFRQRVLNSRTFTNLLATFVKQQVHSIVYEWRLDAKKVAHRTKKTALSGTAVIARRVFKQISSRHGTQKTRTSSLTQTKG